MLPWRCCRERRGNAERFIEIRASHTQSPLCVESQNDVRNEECRHT